MENTEADVVLNALVGALGLQPTLAALASGARLALANKESLVAGGPLVVRAAQPGQIVPVDSEHSALAQCLRSGRADEVAKLVLTASGGPFRGWSAADLEAVTPEQAGAHPTWNMGPMNTLNSASLVNKGLELIETHLLFGDPVRPHRRRGAPAVDRALDGDVHRRVDHRPGQPAGHETADLAGAGLAGPGRRSGGCLRLQHRLHLGVSSRWTPRCSPRSTWPGRPGSTGGCMTAVYNAANEEAAAAFLAGRIGFRPSCEQSLTYCTPPTSGPPNRLPWKRYLTRSDGLGNALATPSHRRSLQSDDVRYSASCCSRSPSCVSVALHECGHMWVARATGMKVRRYFVGFGPTLWSTLRPNRLGYTEYGVKAVPARWVLRHRRA